MLASVARELFWSLDGEGASAAPQSHRLDLMRYLALRAEEGEPGAAGELLAQARTEFSSKEEYYWVEDGGSWGASKRTALGKDPAAAARWVIDRKMGQDFVRMHADYLSFPDGMAASANGRACEKWAEEFLALCEAAELRAQTAAGSAPAAKGAGL